MTALPQEYIANNTLDTVHDVLGQISRMENLIGKNTYDKLEFGEKKYIGSDACGFVNYFLYYSEITNKKYCMKSGMYNRIYKCAIIESNSDFDLYI
jgi:hypothetical protein